VPQGCELVCGESRLRIRNTASEIPHLIRAPVTPPGARGESLEEVLVLLGVEVLRDSIEALKGHDVAAERDRAAVRLDLGDVFARCLLGPVRLESPRGIAHRLEIDR